MKQNKCQEMALEQRIRDRYERRIARLELRKTRPEEAPYLDRINQRIAALQAILDANP